MSRISRRAFLQGIGASAAMLPLLHAERAFGAGPSGFPKRLVTVTWTNGVIGDDFYPTGSTLTFGGTLKALEPFKAKITMPIGLNQKVVMDAAGGREYDGHFTFPSLLTGTAEQKSEGRIGQGPSLDVVISDAIKQKVTLAAPVLNLGVRSTGDGNPTTWRAAGQMIKPETDPASLFKRLFASAALPKPEIDKLSQRRKSVLDFLTKDLTGFSQRLGTEDRAKVQQHLDSIRELENQLSGLGSAASCTTPTLASGNDTPTLMKSMFDLAAVALQCDLTRVVTFDLYDDGGGDGNNFPWIGVTDDYHTVAHQGAAGAANKIKIDGWIFSNIASLVAKLDATPEAGATALDHSVVMTMNDMDDGANHYVGNIPYVLIGSCGGYLKTGQVVRYNGVAHNKLLATICNAMDVPVAGFGAAGYGGTLPELVA